MRALDEDINLYNNEWPFDKLRDLQKLRLLSLSNRPTI